MKRLNVTWIAVFLSLCLTKYSVADENPKVCSSQPGQDKCGEHSQSHKSDDKEKHAEKDGHKHSKEDEGHEEHGEEEDSSSVGPDKGILAKGEEGIQLAPEAVKTFELKTTEYSGSTFKISKDAIVYIKDDKTIFRLRNGWYKRVPFRTVSSTEDILTVESSSFKSGDKIVVQATGFLRMAEVASEGGMAHEH